MSLIPKRIKNRLSRLSGEDFAIISQCSDKIQSYYSQIGFLVLIILIFSFASALIFTEKLFHNVFADIGIGLIWGYIVTNMYVLLLYTISPTLLPVKIRKKRVIKTKDFELSLSMFLRISIVILLAIIISQPLNVLLLKPNSIAMAFDIKYLLATNPFAAIITLIVVSIFLLPIYLKYSIRKLGEFYEKKSEIEKLIIEDEYKELKKAYCKILKTQISEYNITLNNNLKPLLNKLKLINPDSYNKYLLEIEDEIKYEKYEKYEYWNDHPFRTIYKSKSKNLLSEKDLINHIYSKID